MGLAFFASFFSTLPGRVPHVHAATATLGGINVEPAARPWRYVGANPDGWWCPVGQCTTADPLGRIDTEMSLAHQLNVANLRLEIPWFLVEPSRGGYDWTRADYIFSSASAHGVQINPILVYTPSWGGGYNAFPAAADFSAFVSTFMGRYGGRISAVEMWNEPDGGQSLAANDPTKYVNSILIPGYNAVKQSAHANVKVIEGGSINDSGTCCTWLNGIYAAGGGNYFDIAAFHDYGGNYSQIAGAYQGVLNAHGQGSKPIWLGEFGVSDSTGSQQSSLILAAMANTAALAVAQFYTLRDESVYTCCPPAPTGEAKQYGVVASNDVTKKSSFYTMQSLLGGSSPPPPPATTPPAATPPAQPPPTTAAHTPTPAKPSAGATSSPGHSPSPTAGAASPGAVGSTGQSGPGASGGDPISPKALLLGSVNGGSQIFDFSIVLVGVLGIVLGLLFALSHGAVATRVPGLGMSILSRSAPIGFGIAAGGAVICLVGILLLSQLPRTG